MSKGLLRLLQGGKVVVWFLSLCGVRAAELEAVASAWGVTKGGCVCGYYYCNPRGAIAEQLGLRLY